MDEFALYVLDISMNSVRAGATKIEISLLEEGQWLWFSVTDNGCGMTEEQVKRLSDPFFTTRKTRKVGLGIPFLSMLAEMTGGWVKVTSVSETVSPDHGTKTEGKFGKDHIDFIPLGDMTETVKTLIQGSPDVHFLFSHKTEGGEVSLDTAELTAVLGDGISLAEPEILTWIGENLREQYDEVQKNKK